MPRNTPETQLLTKYENEVLDVFHRSLRIWSRPRPQAVFATLAAFDLLNAPTAMALAAVSPNAGSVQQLKWLHDSLIFALRFFWQELPISAISPELDDGVSSEAEEFLIHCKDYALLADFHTGLNRGLFQVEIDESKRLVRFVTNAVDGSAPDPLGILEEYPKGWQHIAKAMQKSSIAPSALAIYRSVPHHFDEGRVVLDDISPLTRSELDDFTQLMMPPEKRRLADSADLSGFTSGDFHRFWLALFKWSVAAFGAYCDAWFSGRDQHKHLPTQFVRRDALVAQLSQIAGLSIETTDLCIQRLTFGYESAKKPDIFLQPLLLSGDFVAWSAYLIQLAFPERNMLKLMARIPRLKAVADNLIALQEAALVTDFSRLLNGHGFEYKTHIELPGSAGEIDILMYHSSRPDEVLIVEAKGVLDPDEVNEVGSNTETQQEGQNQLRRVIDVLQKMSPEEKKALWKRPDWNRVSDYYGVVVTPSSQPNATYDHSEFPAITFDTAKTRLRPCHYKSPYRLWSACVEKPWLSSFQNRETVYRQIQIGDVTYEIPGQKKQP